MKYIFSTVLLTVIPLYCHGQELMCVGCSGNPPDFVIYTMNTAPPGAPGINDDQTSLSGFQVYVSMWKTGKVIMGSSRRPVAPYWELQLSPNVISPIIEDSITSASRINQTYGDLPGHIDVEADWPYNIETDRRHNIRGSMLEFTKLGTAEAHLVTEQSSKLYSLINSILDRLPAAETGTQRQIKWTY